MFANDRSGREKSIFEWIGRNLSPESCTSEEFIYNEMESQSGYSLPVIYQPFDASDRWHWSDRGMLYDFLYSTNGEGKKLLDFGPGDGWPSLIVAPFAMEVIGIDASETRIKVCTENAKRLGINNASFVSYKPGTELPFEDNTFDGIMAASSIEQTPDPRKTLEELYRILKPGGRIRIYYEALSDYKGGFEKDIWIVKLSESACKMVLYDRDWENEYALQYGLTVDIPEEELKERLSGGKEEIRFDQVSVAFLEEIKNRISRAQVMKTIHPSGKTWVSWLKAIGFKEVLPSYSGGMAASELFDLYSDDNRPSDLKSVDEAIKKVVKIVTGLEAPIDFDPMITAVK
ncbi:methyltransferase domain-containing protein [Acetivibrio thermocellus]|uniref:class I SAM-dependent methyltransferase n=1 Tax=Acetivibrio thermocellus TaxID=1515 RepID=UPI0021ADE0CE|nr:methyltransferase domain-containing protein [Acetivibrio thermocellus]UWV47697.1 methyltransferase domain-containing protein [Acetivibrio thermocellus]